MKSRRCRVATVAALATTGLVATTGLAYASGLPGAAAGAATSALERVGVTVPGPNLNAGSHPNTRGRSVLHPASAPHAASTMAAGARPSHDGSSDTGDGGGDTGDATGTSKDKGNGQGSTISALAHSTTATGRDKGAVISTAASDGRSHAGNPPGQASGKPAAARPRPPHPAHPSHPAAPTGGAGKHSGHNG